MLEKLNRRYMCNLLLLLLINVRALAEKQQVPGYLESVFTDCQLRLHGFATVSPHIQDCYLVNTGS